MACADPLIQFDDQSFALQLQLEEINAQRERQSEKWPEDSPPDFVLAFDDFEAELRKLTALVEDLKFAHSIARAVDSDGLVIEELRAEEAQSVQDRSFARSLNEDQNPLTQDDVELPGMSRFETESVEWDDVMRATEASTFSVDSYNTVAGPSNSAPYAQRQIAVLEHLPQRKVECSVCGDYVHPHATVRLACNDIYCKPCLKSFFLRVTKDETLFPPKCHGELIDISIIEADFSVEELGLYRSAEAEFSSTDRVYCANAECAKFIPMPQRARDRAICRVCSAETCIQCKALAHDGDCPADETKQSLIRFAEEQGWMACFGCGEMVFRYEGCNHMTCRYRSEFCYRCGIKWKECSCSDWEPELRDRRARQIVDREAEAPLAPAVRQARVVAMARELLATHECDHRNKFTRIGGGNVKTCEICGDTHRKYILSCKRCHLYACEYCRRYRI